MVFQCCVRGCKIISKNGLLSFPSNKEIAQKWIAAIRNDEWIKLLNENKLSRSYKKVCKKHFSEHDFEPNTNGKIQLVANSVPSLFLPDADTVVIIFKKHSVGLLKCLLCIACFQESPQTKQSIPLKPPKRLQQARRPNSTAVSNVTHYHVQTNHKLY